MDESQNDYAKTKNKQKGILFDFIQVKCYKTQTESRLVVVQGESMMGRGGGGQDESQRDDGNVHYPNCGSDFKRTCSYI